jgi:hypothetical protein
LHQIHYEILETRKQKLLKQQWKNGLSHADGANYFVYKEKDFPSILGDIHSRLVSKVNGNALAVDVGGETRSKRLQDFPTILNDIHLHLTPKTQPQIGHSSDIRGEEDGKYMWIPTSTGGIVTRNI